MGEVDPRVRELAQQANFAAFTVLLRSGTPMTHVMWVDADDDHVLINTEVHRAKFKAIERDPRVTVMIWKRDDPYSYVEVRGRVVETVRTGPWVAQSACCSAYVTSTTTIPSDRPSGTQTHRRRCRSWQQPKGGSCP